MSDYYIPEPLVEQILLRLPPATLVRFCLVFKSWYSLITSNSFISSHLLHFSLSNPTTTTAPILLIQGKPTLDPHSCRLVDSLNGLVCFYEQYDRTILLWNPSIRRHLTLPLLPVVIPFVYLVKAIGFGFDSINNDFKVIVVFFHPCRVELYSLNQRSWSEVNFPFDKELTCYQFSDTRCFLNGNVHWIMTMDNKHSHHRSTNHLLIINVVEEKFTKSQFPRDLFRLSQYDISIMVIEGCISVLRCQEDNDSYDIWMMREYGVVESWNKVHTLRKVYNSVWHAFGLRTGGGVIELPQSHEHLRVSLHSFDLTSEEIKDLETQDNIYVIGACEYIESLALSDGYPIY